MGIRSKSQAQTTLDLYYQALDRVAAGKSFTLSTENGTRTLTEQDLPHIQSQITRLERIVTNDTGARHNVSVANFNT